MLFAAWLRSETEKAKDKATPVTDSEEEEAAYIQEKRKKSKETDIAIALCDLQNPHPPQNSRVTTVN